MISFTKRTFLLVAITAFGHLLAPWLLPWWIMAPAMVVVAAAIVLDAMITRPAFAVSRRFPSQMQQSKSYDIELTIDNAFRRALDIEVEDCTPPSMAPESARFAARVPAGESAPFTYRATPMRRGSFVFGETYIRATGVMGLVRRKVALHAPDTIRVFPNLDDFRKYQLFLRSPFFHTPGQKHARVAGEGAVFESLREYQKDDEYSRIDWKATARMRKPITREYEPERNQNVIIMMDTGRLMGATVQNITKLDYAIRTALALGIVCVAKGDNVGLVTFDSEVRHFLAPSRGKEHFVKIMDALYSVFPAGTDPDYGNAFQYLLKKKMRRSLIVVFTDLVDADASQALLDWLCVLHPRHARLCILLEDSEVRDLAAVSPADEDTMFRKDIAMTLLEKKRYATARLKSKGVGVVEARPEQLSLSAIKAYLHLKNSRKF